MKESIDETDKVFEDLEEGVEKTLKEMAVLERKAATLERQRDYFFFLSVVLALTVIGLLSDRL